MQGLFYIVAVLQVTSERQVFNAVVAWVEVDAEGRSAAFPRLLGE